MMGGEGVWTGVPQIIAAALGGLLVRQLSKSRIERFFPIVALAGVVSICGSAGFYVRLPASIWAEVTLSTVAPLAFMLFGATLLCGLAIVQEMKRQEVTQQNTVFRAVIEALPDCLNAKDRDGRFIVANPATAALMGTDVASVVGKTDADFYGPDTAEIFRKPELQVLLTGEPITVEQRFVRRDGNETWLSTLKAPLFDDQGHLTGIVTHNREITERKKLEQELQASRLRLDDAIESMVDGIAMFDIDGVLVFHNRRFQLLFPMTADVRVPGNCMRTIVQTSLERGEQAAPKSEFENVVERTADILLKEGERLMRLSEGRAISAKTTRTADGGSMIVFSDVTEHRAREEQLQQLNEKLSLLASTDSLTGLTNRRAFDVALSKVAQPGRQVSLLMIDVDRFKSFNDGYGHPEGDECLRKVADRLSGIFSSISGSVVTRYGGEEFVITLPGMDVDQAHSSGVIACSSIRDMEIPHEYCDTGIVTVSIGVASTSSGRVAPLLKAADAALYAAKAAGRNCVRVHQDDRAQKLA